MDRRAEDLAADQQSGSSRRHVLVIALDSYGYYGVFMMPENPDDHCDHLFDETVETPPDDEIIMYHPSLALESLVTNPVPFLSSLVDILYGMAATVGFHKHLVMVTHVGLPPEEFARDLEARLKRASLPGPESALQTMSVTTFEAYFGED